MSDPNRHTTLAQMRGTPRRRFYTGPDLARAVAIADLHARSHIQMPKFVLEYMEGGAEEEATLDREREVYADWRFRPKTLVDVAERSVSVPILGRLAPAPLIVAPTGLNGIFMHGADVELARGAAKAGAPFVQSTMSNELIETVAATPDLRHWFQLYVFGGDEVWQELVDRAASAGCEALVLTTNSQIYGNREWDTRTRATRTRPSWDTIFDAALHPGWVLRTLFPHGMPIFANIIDFAPRDKRGFFESAFWVRDQMRQNLSWGDVSKIRDRWKGPFILKGVLDIEDVEHARDAGVDGVVLSTHGGRQLDYSVTGLDVIAQTRARVGDAMSLFISGGVRRGTDIIKAMGLGADAIMAGRACLYGLCAGGADGVARALEILQRESVDALGLLGASHFSEIASDQLVSARDLPPRRPFPAEGPSEAPNIPDEAGKARTVPWREPQAIF